MGVPVTGFPPAVITGTQTEAVTPGEAPAWPLVAQPLRRAADGAPVRPSRVIAMAIPTKLPMIRCGQGDFQNEGCGTGP